MENIVEFLKKEPKKEYTITDFVKFNLVPWARDGRTVEKILKADHNGSDILHAKITGTDTYRRYLVQGRYIINYLQIYGPHMMVMVRQPKIYGRTKISESGNRAKKRPQKHL